MEPFFVTTSSTNFWQVGTQEAQDLEHQALALLGFEDELRVRRPFENHELFRLGRARTDRGSMAGASYPYRSYRHDS
jgi:hypothetical protein